MVGIRGLGTYLVSGSGSVALEHGITSGQGREDSLIGVCFDQGLRECHVIELDLLLLLLLRLLLLLLL